MSLNRVILLGRLGKDPEIRYAQSGTTVATVTIATDERKPDGNGGWKKHTEWHRVVMFGKTADAAKQYLAKGREVLIEGSLTTRQWQDQAGGKRYTTEVICQNMRFVGGKPAAGGTPIGNSGGTPIGSAQPEPIRSAAPAQTDTFDDFGAGDFADTADDSDIPF